MKTYILDILQFESTHDEFRSEINLSEIVEFWRLFLD